MSRLVTVALLGLTTWAGGAAAQEDFSDVEIRVTPIRDDLFMLSGAGGNILLSLGADGPLIVDTEYGRMAARVQQQIGALGGDTVRVAINTHFHGDHRGGNVYFTAAGANLFAHTNVYKRLEALTQEANRPTEGTWLPHVSFDSRFTIHWNGHWIHLRHVPSAHTDGDTVVYFADANVIHMGDTFLNMRYPFVDVNAGGSLDGIIAACHEALTRSDSATVFVPGHGDVADRDDLIEYVTTLEILRERLSTLISQGRSEDQAVAAKPTAEFDAAWGNGFQSPESFTRLAYQSLAD